MIDVIMECNEFIYKIINGDIFVKLYCDQSHSNILLPSSSLQFNKTYTLDMNPYNRLLIPLVKKLSVHHQLTEFNEPLPYVDEITFEHVSHFNFNIRPNTFPNLKKIIFPNLSTKNKDINITALSFPNIEEIYNYPNIPIKGETYQKLRKITFAHDFNSEIQPNILQNVEEVEFTMVAQHIWTLNHFIIRKEMFPQLKRIIFPRNSGNTYKFTGDKLKAQIEEMKNVDSNVFFNGNFPKLKKISFEDNYSIMISPQLMPNIEEIDNFPDIQLVEEFTHLKKISFSVNYGWMIDCAKIPNIEHIYMYVNSILTEIYNKDTRYLDPNSRHNFKNIDKLLTVQHGTGFYMKYLKYKTKYHKLKLHSS